MLYTDIDLYLRETTANLSQNINNKIKIYLDTKYWIDICDVTLEKKNNNDIIEIYRLIKKGVKANNIICPISYRIFKEVLKQDDEKSLKQTIFILDELSQGTILKDEKDRLSLELFNFFYDLFKIDTDKKYRENYWDYIINIFGCYIPKYNKLSYEENLLIQKKWIDNISTIDFKKMFFDSNLKNIREVFKNREINIELYNQNKDLYSNEHKSFKQMYMAELTGTIEANQEIIKKIFKSIVDKKAKLSNININIPNKDLVDIQPLLNIIYQAFKQNKMDKQLPSIDINAAIHAKLRWNKTQRYKKGDFDDIGHAKSALPYYDYFFTEKSLHNIIKEIKYDKKYGCTVISSNREIINALNIILEE